MHLEDKMSNESNLKRVRFLESERIFLTPLEVEDVDENYKWDHDLETRFFDSWACRPELIEKVKKDIEEIGDDKKMMFFTIIRKKTGENIGRLVLYQINYLARTAIWGMVLDKDCRCQGYGSEAGKMLLKYAFEDLGLVKLESGTHSGNPGSARLQEGLGMIREGLRRKNRYLRGKYYDSLLYGMTADEYRCIYNPEKGRTE
jgi:ribosomal-protein-alanine N-acetyltransferase